MYFEIPRLGKLLGSALVALSAVAAGSTARAQDIQTKDDLDVYLSEALNYDGFVTTTVKLGDEFGVDWDGRNCFSRKSLDDLPPIAKILHRELGATFAIAKVNAGFVSFGSYPCYLRIERFNDGPLRNLGLSVEDASDVKFVRIPLAKQDFLGTENVSLVPAYVGYEKCDISFVPWFRNHSQSDFVLRFRSLFAEDHYYKALFNEEAKTDPWCFKRKYDGSVDWIRSYRY